MATVIVEPGVVFETLLFELEYWKMFDVPILTSLNCNLLVVVTVTARKRHLYREVCDELSTLRL